MATFVVCTRCGKTHEVSAIDELPTGWKRVKSELLCPHCCKDTGVLDVESDSDVLDEEVIYPNPDRRVIDESFEDTLDEGEGYCEICDGPCQGH